MNITVLGCGALGQIWLTALGFHGHNIQGWLKTNKSQLNIVLIDLIGNENHLQFSANNSSHLAKSDLLIVTLKAWQVSVGVQGLLPQLRTDCGIILLHNGFGTQEELPALTQPLIIGNTTHAAYSKEEKIYYVSRGITRIGPGNNQAQQSSAIAKVLHTALPPVIWHQDVMASIWMKLAVNAVINPLTTVYSCRNGELIHYLQKIKLICYEIALVMTYEGHQIYDQCLLLYVKQIILRTKNNISSMLQDIQAKRKSEIDYITGYILQRACIHGLDIPENRRLFELIKKKEANYIKN
ncbi:2-dehydropantoate 2-reductase [secondary endosymbiont of Heteropsylla cubana]|uniref:2-dehydropantoate 2-reductase n=1 Tax=secondary endosymbiont of Heteropsylla cubana TaxID=134287 RepID=J3Z545_9ENTR|nr:2-dehydropantoate 2-reductase [secondary endosymbiont of Heteropsylla cubana]AFP85419.1 2-dehydropantoate 2-reductase [secondary endosymbiont of Heteropsylla cubana]